MEKKSTLPRLFSLAALLLSFSVSSIKAQQCPKPPGETSSCVCQTDSGIIDLRPLGSEDTTKPRFSVKYNGHDYIFNPCYGVNFGVDGDCSDNTAVCQHLEGEQARSCGSITSELILGQGPNYLVDYISGTGGRTSKVNLICDENTKTPEFTATRDVDLNYEFNLKAECICPGKSDKCPGSGGGGSGGSGAIPSGDIGIAVIVLLLLGFVSYFVVGAVILKFKFEKTGVDIIPQKQFWFLLPYLIKDGVIFTFNPLIKKIKKENE